MEPLSAEIVSKELIASFFQPRQADSHKGTYGHALLVAGNKGKMGAAVLSAKACLRSGTGLLTVNAPEIFSSIIHVAVPEAMITAREEAIDFSKYKSIGIGPGMGTDKIPAGILKNILSSFKGPVLIDADALTILSEHKAWLSLIPEGAVLTPHPKEFDRLFGESATDAERAAKAISLSKTYPFVLILKGHHTLITSNGRAWYNQTGNAGLAKGGSGDVLTGMITALFAQSYTSLQAALMGVYLHGLAADITLDQQSMESMLATDVIDNFGKAFKSLNVS